MGKFFRSLMHIEQKIVLTDIPITCVGEIVHVHKKFTRLIAGDPIPDQNRRAMILRPDNLLLPRHPEYPDDECITPVKGAFAGSMGFLDYRITPRSNAFPGSICLGYMGVEPDWRRMGVGSSLLRKVEEIARKDGYANLYGFVREDRIKSTESFWTKNGFTIGDVNNSWNTYVNKDLEIDQK